MYEDFFSSRLTQLRLSKNVSARDMSLSIGQSESYINKIENGKSFPSMQSFFYICEYLKITPKDFFEDDVSYPAEINQTLEYLKKLDSENLSNILNIVKSLSE